MLNQKGKSYIISKANHALLQTSRGRPKPAPYLRHKNSKRTSKCQSIGELGTLFMKKVSQCRKNRKGIFQQHAFCRKTPKN